MTIKSFIFCIIINITTVCVNDVKSKEPSYQNEHLHNEVKNYFQLYVRNSPIIINKIKRFHPNYQNNFLSSYESINKKVDHFFNLHCKHQLTKGLILSYFKIDLDKMNQLYNILLEDLSKTRFNKLLSDQNYAPINIFSNNEWDTIIANYMGNDFVKNSGLEGISRKNILDIIKFRIHILEKFKQDRLHGDNYLDSNIINPCQKSENFICQNRNINQKNNFVEDFSNDEVSKFLLEEQTALKLLQSLSNEKEEHFLNEYRNAFALLQRKLIDEIPLYVGWEQHAIKISIKRKKNEKLYLRIYNSGEKSRDYHLTLQYGYRHFIFPYVERPLTPEYLNSLYFIDLIYNIYNDNKERPLSPEDIYDKFFNKIPIQYFNSANTLDNILEEEFLDEKYNSYQYLEDQKSGVCGGYIFSYSNKSKSPKSDLLEDIFKWKMISEYIKANNQTNNHTEEKYQLGIKSLRMLLGDIQLKIKKGYSDAGLLKFIGIISNNYQVILDHWKKSYLSEMNTRKKNQFFGNLTTRYNYIETTTDDITNFHYEQLTFDKMIPMFKPIKNQFKSINEIMGALNFTREVMTKYYHMDNTLYINQIATNERVFITSLIKNWPLDHSFWYCHQVPTEALEQMISALKFLNVRYINSLGQKSDLNQISSVELMISLKILTLADKILAEYHKRMNKNYRSSLGISLNSTHLSFFMDGKLSSFYIEDPEIDNDFKKIQEYWKNYSREEYDTFDYSSFPPPRDHWGRTYYIFNNSMELRRSGNDSRWNTKINKYRISSWNHLKWLLSEAKNSGRCNNLTDLKCVTDICYKSPPIFLESFTLAEATYLLFTSRLSGNYKSLQDLKNLGNKNIKYSGIFLKKNEGRKRPVDYAMMSIDYKDVFQTEKYVKSDYSLRQKGDYKLEKYQGIFYYPNIGHIYVQKYAYNLDSIFDESLTFLQDIYREYKINSKVPYRERIHISSNDIINKLPSNEHDQLSFEKFRELINLSSNENLQIIETLSFYKKNLGYLSKLNYQKLFLGLIFEANKLTEAINKYPKMPEILHSFCKDALDTFNENTPNIRLLSFILKINYLFAEKIRNLKPLTINELNLHFFKNPKNLFIEYINGYDLNHTEELKIILSEYMLTFRTRNTSFSSIDEFKYFIMGGIIQNIYTQIEQEIVDLGTLYELENIYDENILYISEFFGNFPIHIKKKILNEIIGLFQYSPVNDWKKYQNNHLLYHSNKNNMSLDLKSGRLFYGGSSWSHLPSKIKLNPEYDRIINFKKPFNVYESDHFYLITDFSGNKYKIERFGENRLFKLFYDHWYVLKNEDNITKKSNNDVKPMKLISHYDHWMWVTSDKDLEIKNEVKGPYVSKDSNFNNEIVSCDKKTGKVRYVTKFDTDLPEKNHFIKIKSIHLVENNKMTNYLRYKISDTDSLESHNSFHILRQIENPEYIFIWVDTNGQFYKGELPRLGLSLKLKDNKILCPELGNLELSKDQSLKNYEHLENFIVFNNILGEKKVLSRHFNYKSSPPNVLNPNNKLSGSVKISHLEFETITEDEESNSLLYMYDYIEAEKKLVPLNLKSRIHLAYLELCSGNYIKSKQLIDGFKENLGSFSQSELSKLYQIVNFSENTNDPRISGVSMISSYLIFKNKLLFSKLTEKDHEDISEKYYNFLQVIDLIGQDSWITTYEELFLINYLKHKFFIAKENNSPFGKYSLAFDSRYRFLTKKNIATYESIPSNHTSSQSYSFYLLSLFENLNYYQSENFVESKFLLDGTHLLSNFEDIYKILSKYPEVEKSELEKIINKLSHLNTSLYSVEELFNYLKLYISHLALITNNNKVQLAAAFLQEFLLNNKIDISYEKIVSLSKELKDENLDWWDRRVKVKKDISKIFSTQTIEQKNFSRHNQGHYEPQIIEYGEHLKGIQQIPMVEIDTDINKNIVLNSNFLLDRPIISLKDHQTIFLKNNRTNIFNDKTLNELTEVYNLKSSEKLFNTKLLEFKNKIEIYTNKVKNSDFYILKSKNHLQKLYLKLMGQRKDLDAQLCNKWDEIINKINKLPNDELIKQDEFIKRITEQSQEVTKENLISFIGNSYKKNYFSQYHYLTDKSLKYLYQQIIELMLKENYRDIIGQHENDCKIILNKLEITSDHTKAINMINKLASNLLRRRSYHILDNPNLLAFEYIQKILLREDQIEAYQRLTHNKQIKGNIIEAVMGSGKTFFLLPAAAAKMADGNNLSIIVIPENLIPSMSTQLNQTIGILTGHGIENLQFERNTDYNEFFLRASLERIEEGRKKGHVFLMSNSSIKSLFLKFIEDTYKKSDQEIINLYRQILNTFKTFGHVLIDEVDMAFDVRMEHIFSLNESTHLEDITSKVVKELYKTIAEMGQSHNSLCLPFLKSNCQAPFTETNYNIFKKDIMTHIFAHNSTFLEETRYHKYFKRLNPEEVQKYILGQKSHKDMISDLDNDISKNIISIIYDELIKYFPLTLNKKLGAHYGPLPDSQKFHYAIPYHSGVPKIKSRFAGDLEFLNYTFQMHIEQKNTYSLLNTQIKRLQKQLMNGNDHETEKIIYQEFNSYLVKNYLYNLRTIKDGDIKIIANELNNFPEKIISLVEKVVIPEIKVFPKLLKTNSQIYSFMFTKVQGLSGTLWNIDTYPEVYQEIFLSETDEKTSFDLWTNGPNNLTIIDSSKINSLNLLINEVFKDCHQFPCSLIDLGGYFTNYNNKEVAQELLKFSSNATSEQIKGIIYYDHLGRIMILDKLGKTLPLSQSNFSKNELIAFWDLPRTTGSDLKLKNDMHAVMTINKFSIDRDMKQAAWRLRGLDSGQKVHFALSDNDKVIMTHFLKHHFINTNTNNFSKKDLLRYFKANEIFRLGELNFKGMKQKIKSLYIKELFLQLLHNPIDETINLIQKTIGFFLENRNDIPHKKFGHKIGRKEKSLSIKQALDEFEKKKYVQTFNSIIPSNFKSNIQKEWYLITKSLEQKVFSFIDTLDGLDREMEIEQEEEQEQENEQEQEQEIQYESHMAKTRRIDWTNEMINQSDCFNTRSEDRLNDSKQRNIILESSTICPVITLNSSLQLQAQSENSFKIFNENKFFPNNLLISLNLDPSSFAYSDNDEYKRFKFFTRWQKFSNNVLVIYENNTLKLMLLDLDDTEVFSKFIQNNRISNPNRWLGIYNFNLGFYLSTDQEMDEFIMKNDDFLNLITKAKFFSGEIKFNNDELQYIKSWSHLFPPGVIENLFVNYFLKIRKDSRKTYKNTKLYQYLTHQ